MEQVTNIDKLINWITSINLNILIPSLIGLIGVLTGIFINEYFKRKERESLFSESIFKKRLSIYETLYIKIEASSEVANEVMKSPDLTKQQRLDIWSEVVLDLASFLDKNMLYINEEVSVHCMLTLIGVEDIYDLPKLKKKTETEKYYKGRAEIKELIKDEMGLKRLDRYFDKINHPKRETSYIKAYKKVKDTYNDK